MSNGRKGKAGLFRRIVAVETMPDDDDWQKDTRRQFVATLRTRLAAALGLLDAGDRDKRKAFIERVDALLAVDGGLSTWRDSFEAEQLICFLETGPLVSEDIRIRLAEAEAKSLPGTSDRAARANELDKAAQSSDDAPKQALLFGLVCDLQRLAQKSYHVRQFRLSAVNFVMLVAFLAVLGIAFPLLAYLFHALLGYRHDAWPADFVAAFPNYGLFSAVAFGILGALFSRFILLQNSEVAVPIDEAAAYYSRGYILLRVFIGMVAATIVYFFAASGLIAGGLVPNVRELTFEFATVTAPNGGTLPFHTWLGTESARATVPGVNYALLVIWSFLAGFSEQLVPNLLQDTAGRIGQASKDASTTGGGLAAK